MAQKRIWQMALARIFLLGAYLLLPAAEAMIARQWLETLLKRLR